MSMSHWSPARGSAPAAVWTAALWARLAAGGADRFDLVDDASTGGSDGGASLLERDAVAVADDELAEWTRAARRGRRYEPQHRECHDGDERRGRGAAAHGQPPSVSHPPNGYRSNLRDGALRCLPDGAAPQSSRRITRAAFCPGPPVIPPPGWAPELARYRPSSAKR